MVPLRHVDVPVEADAEQAAQVVACRFIAGGKALLEGSGLVHAKKLTITTTAPATAITSHTFMGLT